MVKDRYPVDDRIPLFLSNLAEEPEQSRIRKIISSEVFRKAVLVFAVAAVVLAVVSVGHVIRFARVTASEVATPAIQSTASAEALPRTSPDNELLTAFKSALENNAEVDQPGAEALLNQFQAWAAEEDVRASVQPPQPPQPIQAVQAHIVRIPLPKRRPIQVEQAARAQDPSPQNAQSPMRRFGWRN